MWRFGTLGMLVALATTGCATMRVGSDYDREASFATAVTYDWAAAEEVGEGDREDLDRINPFIQRRLERAVDAEMEDRGFRRVGEGPVDLLLSVSVLGAGEVDEAYDRRLPILLGFSVGWGPALWSHPYWRPYSFYPYRWGYRPYRSGFTWGFPYFGYSSAYARYGYRTYGGYRSRDPGLPPGSFVVDVLDGETGEPLWRGWAEGALLYAPEADRLPGFISETVRRIMASFPPGDGRAG